MTTSAEQVNRVGVRADRAGVRVNQATDRAMDLADRVGVRVDQAMDRRADQVGENARLATSYTFLTPRAA
jgi:hypothetical protein